MTIRNIVLFCPDWSLISAYRNQFFAEIKTRMPLGLLKNGVIKECSKLAGEAGVHR